MTDTIEALERLARLKEQGILTAEEFDRQKAAVLGTTTAPSPAQPAAAEERKASDAEANRRNHKLALKVVAVVGVVLLAVIVLRPAAPDPEVGILPNDPERIARVRAEMGLPTVEQEQAAAAAARNARLAQCRKLVDELQASGLITRYSTRPTGGDVYVNPRIWAGIDITNKRALGLAFACIVKDGEPTLGGTLYVQFLDTLSGKRLATMSSVGFQVE